MGRGTTRNRTGACRKRFEGLMIESGDPRVGRWMQRMAEEMEAIKEREGAARAAEQAQRQDQMGDRQDGSTGTMGSDDPPPAQDDDDEDEPDSVRDEQAEDVIMAVTGGRWNK